VPDIISADIDATFGASADLSYRAGFGIDTSGFWIEQGTGISMNFDVSAGIEGDVEVFGIPLASAGGSIGMQLSPSVSLAQDPNSNIPGRDYMSDLLAFGPNPARDFLDALNESITGSIIGTVYAEINLLFFHFGASWEVNIPVFNDQTRSAWPASSSGGGKATQWTNITAVPMSNGLTEYVFNGTNFGDNIQLSQVPDTNNVVVKWKGHGSEQLLNVGEFNYQAGTSGPAQVTTTPGFDIPVDDDAAGDSQSVYFEGGSGGAGSTLIGGVGNDTLIGGGGDAFIQAGTGNDLILGGQGDSTLIGGAGADSIYGGPGDDVILGGSGSYYIDGGGGNDTIYGGQGPTHPATSLSRVIHGGEGNALIIDMSAATAQGFQYPTTGAVASAFAGLGVDPFNAAITIGQSTDDAVPTQIYGNGGADTIYGGSGGDTIVAGTGPSLIYGGAGNDSINGGFGADTLYGGLGNNTIQGGIGNDTIYGGVGYDVGDPLALVSSGSNLLIGGAGNNLIYGDSKASNRLLGSAGSDTLYAGSGGDYLDGGTGSDALYGGAGADTLVVNFNPGGGTDQDTLDGGGGDDTILLKGPPNQDNEINLTLAPGTIETYSASLYNLDNNVYEGAVTFTLPPSVQQLAVYAGTGDTSPGVPANDKVVVDPSVQQGISIFGGDGNNTLVGGSGADTLVGGVGNNVLEGMGGNDMLYGDPGAYPATSQVSLPPGGSALPLSSPGRDTLIGGDGDDQLFAGNGPDLLIGGDAALNQDGVWVLQNSDDNDIMYGGTGADLMIAGPGSTGAEMFAGSGLDTLVGGNGSNILAGGDGSDVLLGGNTQNTMIGDLAKNDTGNSTMVGGAGFDTMIGSNASDVLFADDSTALAQSYWASAIQTGLSEFNVQFAQPPDPFAGLTTVSALLNALAYYQNQELQFVTLVESLGKSEEQYTDAGEPVPASLVAQFANADNNYLNTYANEQIIGGGLYPKTAPTPPVNASFILGGSGTNMIYAGLTPAKLVGGQNAMNTFFESWPQDGADTLQGGSGGENTLVFEDTPGQANTVAFTNSSVTSTILVAIDNQSISMANISGMQNAAADLLGTSDTVTMTFAQKPTLGGVTLGFQIDCNGGSATIDLTGVSVQSQAAAVTIQGGAGSDLIEIDSDIPNPPLYVPMSHGAGPSELVVTGVGSGVTVQGGAGNNSKQLLVNGKPVGPENGYSTLKVIGTSSSTATITNLLGPIAAIGTVTLQGGNGPTVTNQISDAGGTATLIAGAGAVNSYTLNGPGNYTVLGAGSSSNQLTINGDALTLSQTGSIVSATGTENGASLNVTAIDITSLTASGGVINAAGMTLGVTLYGTALTGGAGNDTLYSSGTWSGNDGGGGTDNQLFLVNGAPNDQWSGHYNTTTGYFGIGTVVAGGDPGFIGTAAGLLNSSLLTDENFEFLGFSAFTNGVAQPPAAVYSLGITVKPASPAINSTSTPPNFTLSDTFSVSYVNSTDASITNASYAATIAWGDGSTTSGTVTGLSVSATHVYATNSSHTVVVTIIDSTGGAGCVTTTTSGGLQLDSQGNLLDYSSSSANPSPLATGVEAFIADNDTATPTVFILQTGGNLFVLGQSNPFDTGVQSITLGPDGTLYALHAPAAGQSASGANLDEFAPGSTTHPTVISNVVNLVQDNDQILYRLDAGHSLFELGPIPVGLAPAKTWTLASQNVRSIFLDTTDGTQIDALFEDGDYESFNGVVWTFIAGPQFTFSTPQGMGMPPVVTPGAIIPVTLTAVTMIDGQPVVDTGYTGTVAISVGGGAAGSPQSYTFVGGDTGSHTFDLTLDTAGTQTISVDDQQAMISGSLTVIVDPGQLAGFSIAGPANSTAGIATNFTINAVDAFDNPVPSFNGTVSFTSSDTNSQSKLSAPVSLSNGIGAFTANLVTAGDQEITATDAGDALDGNVEISVVPAAPDQVAVTVPSLVGANEPFSLTLTLEDQYGNTITDDPSGVATTVNFTSLPIGGPELTLFGSPTLAPTINPDDNGVHSYLMSPIDAHGTVSYLAIDDIPNPVPGQNQPFTHKTTFTFQVVPPAQTVVSASATTAVYGAADTLTATVTGNGPGAPTGTVVFYDGSVELGTAALTTTDGVTTTSLIVATVATAQSGPTLAVGPNSITAEYLGDSLNPVNTSAAFTVLVEQPTQVTISASSAAPDYGQAETLTATVSAEAGSLVPTGVVTFYDGSTALGSANLSATGATTVATWITTTLPLGADTITTRYSGDSTDLPGESASMVVAVGQDASQISLTASPNPTALNQSVTLTATVTATGGELPGGSVNFSTGSTPLGTAPLTLVNGSETATLAIMAASLVAGDVVVTAAYAGDTNDAAANNASITVVVGTSGQLATQTALALSTDSSGNEVLTATITASSTGANSPIGTVSFYDLPIDNAAPVQAQLGAPVAVTTSNGVTTAVYTIAANSLTAGNYVITAVYSGDSADLASSSGTVTLTIGSSNQIATETQVIPESSSLDSGDQETITAVVTSSVYGEIPTGKVNFFGNVGLETPTLLGTVTLAAPTGALDSASADFAIATLSTTMLKQGINSIVATYLPSNGTPYLASASPSVTVTVDQATITTVMLSSSSSTFTAGQPITFEATVRIQSTGSDLLICGRICLAGCEAYPLARMRFGRSLSERTRM
jgi:Ca2+-binding RTX toxin-like protein